MTTSKLWFAILMVLVLSVSVSAFDGLELEDSKGIIDGKEIGDIKPVEEVKYCIRADTKEYMPCDGWSKGGSKLELERSQRLFVSMEGTYLYDSKTDTKEFWASKEEASVYVHKVRIDDRGQKVYHVDNLNPVPVDAYVSFWYEQQPGMLWHKNKYSQIVRGYYPSDWTWVQEYTWSDEEGQVVPFGGTLTFLAYDLTENSVGSEQFLVGSFALDDRFYGNNTIANAANLLQNGSGFGKQFYPGNATNVKIADGAMVFNGNSGFVRLPDSVAPSINNPFSVAMWVYKPANSGTSTQSIFSSTINSSTRFALAFNLGNSLRTSFNNGTTNIFIKSGSINYDSWNFVVFTWNGTASFLYSNTVSLTGSDGTTPVSTKGVSLGVNSALNGNNFNGSLSDVRIFNRALNATEVSAMYAQGRGSYSVIGNGLVAQYSGRDYNGTTDNVTTVYDTNHLVSSGPITIANGSGIWAQPYNLTSKTGITFDGVDDYIESNSVNLSTRASWNFWIKRDNLAADKSILSEYFTSGANRQWAIRTTGASSRIAFSIFSDGTNGQTFDLSNTNKIVGEWQHISINYNSTNVEWYSNGIIQGISNTTVNSIFNGTAKMRIAYSQSTYGFFNGSIADVRIYNTSLTPAEVYQIYSGQEIATPAVFVSGLNQDYYRGDSVPVNVGVTGTAIDSVWYDLNGVNSTYTPGLSLSLLTGEYQLRAYANNTLGMIGSSALYSFRMSDVPKGCDDIRLGVNDSFSLASIALIILAAVSIIGILTVGFGGGMSEGVDVKIMIATLVVTGILLSVGIVLFNVITASIC